MKKNSPMAIAVFTGMVVLAAVGSYTEIKKNSLPATLALAGGSMPTPTPEQECFWTKDKQGRRVRQRFTIYRSSEWYLYHYYPQGYSSLYHRKYGICPLYMHFDAGCSCCRRSFAGEGRMMEADRLTSDTEH